VRMHIDKANHYPDNSITVATYIFSQLPQFSQINTSCSPS
jgi:hypothetical protein